MTALDRPQAAVAQLLDILSRIFSYPDTWLLQSLGEKSLGVKLQVTCKEAGQSALIKQVDAVISGIDQTDIESLESDYINLFEHNHEVPPIHLYSGLYNPRQGDRLGMLHDLTDRYRNYGLVREEGAEQLDHLSLMLEFLSFICQQLANTDETDRLLQMQHEIHSTCEELSWAEQLSGGLQKRGGHPLYHPSSRLLSALLRQLQPNAV